jgi:hypothetical protein
MRAVLRVGGVVLMGLALQEAGMPFFWALTFVLGFWIVLYNLDVRR